MDNRLFIIDVLMIKFYLNMLLFNIKKIYIYIFI